MATRIPWNEHEQAILLQALINVLDGKIDRKQAVTKVSNTLRKLAENQGLTIDDRFRNENGISIQMSKLEYVFTQNKSGLKVETGWYFDIARTYKKEPGRYGQLLQEADQMLIPNGTDKPSFSEWLKQNKVEQSSQILMSLYMVNVFLLKDRIIRSNIAKIQDREEIDSIIGQINANKVSSIHSGGRKKYVDALMTYQEYLSFLTENAENESIVADEVHNQDAAVVMELSGSMQREQQIERLSFYEWMIRVQGLAEKFGRSYDSTINTADAFVKEHHIGNEILRGASDAKAVSETIVALFQNEEFIEINNRQHNRFRFALRKYQQYLSCDYAANTETENNVDAAADEFEDVDFTLYREVLSSDFPKGFRIDSKLDLKRFRVFWERKYGTTLADEDDTVRRCISHITIKYGDLVYLPENMMSTQTAQRIGYYIAECFGEGKPAVYYDALYKEFQLELADSRINNPEMLKCYLASANAGKFYFKKSYLTVDVNANVDPIAEVRDYMITLGLPIMLDDLKNALSHIDGNAVGQAVTGSNSDEFVRNQKGEYFHADIIHFAQSEMDTITELIQQAIDDRDYMGGKELTDAIKVKLPSVKERSPFLTWLGLRNVIAYKLQDVFSFRGNIISAYGQDLSMSDVFAHFAKVHDHFTLEQLNSLKSDLGTSIYFDAIYENALRINREEFVSLERASFDVTATDAAISRFCDGDYIAVKEVSFFGSFPDAGFPWNGFMLEHYVANYSGRFRLMHIGFTAGMPTGAVVKKSAFYDDYNDLLGTELANSPIALNRDNALQYLVDAGFLARRNYSDIDMVLSIARMKRSRKE